MPNKAKPPRVSQGRFGLVWFGLVWFGLVWFGLVWFGLVWFGLVWLWWIAWRRIHPTPAPKVNHSHRHTNPCSEYHLERNDENWNKASLAPG